jgi:diguanylate cyclase (GGDEF)-like protein/PAS domain S-box-containing protein
MLMTTPGVHPGTGDGGQPPSDSDASVLFAFALESGRAVTWVLDLTTNRFHFTGGALQLFGPNASAGSGHVGTDDFFSIVHRDDRERLNATAVDSFATGEDFVCEYRTIGPDGSVHWQAARGRPVHDEAGRPLRLVGVTNEITELRAAEAALRETQERMRAVLAAAPILLLAFDHDGVVTLAEGRELAALGDPTTALVGRSVAELLGPPGAEAVQAASAGRPWAGRLPLGGRVYDVSCLPSSDTDDAGLVVATDVTDRAATEEQLEHQALHDALTGLANRERLQRFLDRCAERNEEIALFYLDLDEFKLINDSHGHTVGDSLLRAVAHRLRAAVRAEDLVARVGGDEFVVVCTGMTQAQAQATADRIVTELGRRFERENLDPSGASVGVVVARAGSVSSAELLRRADEAMYAAKRAGRGRWRMAPAGEAPWRDAALASPEG